MAYSELDLRYWGRQRVTRRRLLAGTVAGGAALGAIGLVGCGGDGDKNGNGDRSPVANSTNVPQDGYQDGAAKPGGILNTRQNPALPTMNVFGPGILILAQGLTLGFTVYDHMWYVPTDTGVAELFLAKTLEQPDALTLIATIGDATFHNKAPVNGRKVTTEDIAASFKRFREEAPIGFSWQHHVMEDIVATDDRTVTITQSRPWAWSFTSSNAGSPIFSSIIPQEIHRGYDELLRTDAIGSGHWVLAGHDNGANLRLRKFQNFRTFQNGRDITGQPYLNGVNLKYIADDNAAFAAFLSGEIDVAGFSRRSQMQDAINELGDRIVTSNDLSRDYVNMMMRADPPFDDERVRKAFNLLINRDEAIAFLEDGDAVKIGPLPKAHKKYVLPDDDPDLQEYWRTDPGEAKQLLEAANFDFDAEYEVKHSNRPVDSDLAQVLEGQFRKGGVKLKLVQEELVKWFTTTLNQSQFQITCFQHLPYEDPDLPLRFYLAPEPGQPGLNFMQYRDDDVNRAVLAAAQELDEEARIEKVHEAQRVIMRKYAPMFNLYSGINFAGRYDYVKGLITGRGSFGLFNRTSWLDDEGRRAET